MLVASMELATEVAVLALYSKSKDCATYVRVRARPLLSEAVIGVEKSHLIFLQAVVSMVFVCSCSVLFALPLE